MGIGIVIMGVLLFVSVLRLWSYDRQLKEWAEQLTQTDEYSNLRLMNGWKEGSRRASARNV